MKCFAFIWIESIIGLFGSVRAVPFTSHCLSKRDIDMHAVNHNTVCFVKGQDQL